jgi:trimeric autotransporter adhesin
MRRLLGFAAVLACACPGSALASPPTTADPGLPVTDGAISSIASTGGAAFVAGRFSVLGPRTGSALEFNSATGAVTALPDVAGGGVEAVLADGSGGWYIGGDFDRVAGTVRYGLAHILANGSVDAAFPQLSHELLSQSNTNDSVTTLALSADGKTLYVGGFFVQLGGQARRSIAAVSTASDSVTSWVPELEGSFPGVSKLVVGTGTTSDDVFVAGDFTGVGSVAASDLAKISTSTGDADSSFEPDPTASGGGPILYALAVSTSGSSLYVGGYFFNIGGAARGDLARVATTGASEGQAEAWDPKPDSEIFTIAVQPGGGTVFAAGLFGNVGGQPRAGVAALSSSTGDATSWNADLTNATVDNVSFDAGDVLLVGEFEDSGSTVEHRAQLIDASSGAVLVSFAPSIEGEAGVGAGSGTSVFVGGVDMTSGGAARDGLAELDPYGHLTAFAPTFSGPMGAEIGVVALAPDGKTLYVGGDFSTVDGQPRADLAAFDVATGALTSWHSAAANGEVSALAFSLDGKTLYAGGTFDHLGADDQPRKAIGAVSTADGDATAWNPGVNGSFPAVQALALSPDGSTVYVGGAFTSAGANAQPRTDLAAISATGVGDATAWAPNPHGGPAANVYSLAVGSDGTVYVGGTFTTAGSNALARPNLAAIGAAGSGPATGWNPTATTSDSGNPAAVRALALVPGGGTLFVGGQFDQLGDESRIDLGEVSLATAAATAWNPDPGPYFGDVAALSDTGATLHAGGAFTRVGDDGDQDYAQFTSLPASTALPTIAGTAAYHKTLTCRPGTFSNSPLSYAYAWTRDGRAIAAQTGTRYRVLGSDSGHALGCRVTATNARGSDAASSRAVTPGPYISSFSLSDKKHRRVFKFSITERAKVTVTLYRLQSGVKSHGKCRARSRRRHGRRCTRPVKIGSISHSSGIGTGKLKLGPKVGRHRLGHGRYEAIVTARDSGRRKSNSRTVKFKL